MRGDTDAQKKEDELHSAADRSAGKSLLWHEISWHLSAGKTGGPDRSARVADSSNGPRTVYDSEKNLLKMLQSPHVSFKFFQGVVSEQKGQISSPGWHFGAH